MKYRPEGCNAQKVLDDFGEITSFTRNEDLVNAGMDAILRALVEAEGKQSITLTYDDKAGTVLSFGIQAIYKGTLVFIPEETE